MRLKKEPEKKPVKQRGKSFASFRRALKRKGINVPGTKKCNRENCEKVISANKEHCELHQKMIDRII